MAGACFRIGLLNYLESELLAFVNGIAAQRCEAPLTNANSSDILHVAIQLFLAINVTIGLDHYISEGTRFLMPDKEKPQRCGGLVFFVPICLHGERSCDDWDGIATAATNFLIFQSYDG